MGQTKPIPAEWQTHSEKTNYRETPRYEETLQYCRRLQAASNLIRLTSFGKSGEGRELPLVVATEGGEFDPEAARKSGKAIVLIQACIHAGESDGKDAGLALLRDIAITKTQRGLLKQVVLLFIPIYNVDGHERFGPYNRINQNGPAEMGWRANTVNLNLNRDYMKADAPETRAWLSLWNNWNPDLFVDCHVTDGADYQYNITYQYEHFGNISPSIVAWEREAFDNRIAAATEAAGNLVSSYLEFRDNRDLTKGINSFIGPPRFSTGYVPVRNRPALLIETHMLKDYHSRVKATYDMLKATLDEVNRDPQSLKKAGLDADREVVEEGSAYDPSYKYPMQFELTDRSVPHQLKGVEYKTELSAISGAQRVIFGSKPIELTVPLYDDARTTASVTPPRYYVIPPQWTSVIDILATHGLRFQRLKDDTALDVESYRFSEIKFASSSFEGRVMPSYKASLIKENRRFPKGSVVLPLDQAAARVAIYLLEPDSPDSFVAWGFFNSVFEQKEYGESYVLEKLAREMLEKDLTLKHEFEQKVASDPKFASDARARLGFFFQRSQFWDKELNLYPVGRIVHTLDRSLFVS
jgi:murein tripeptide amidase MpaA